MHNVIGLLGIALVAQAAPQVRSITVTPAVVTEIDLGRMQGKLLRQLAWSPKQDELYLMTYDANRDASIKEAFHYVIPVAGGAPRKVDAQPDWATAYWQWKSAQASPDDPALKIEVAQEKRREDAVAIPFGGDLARGGTADPASTGMSQEAALDAARAMQNNNVYSMKLKGQVIGEWINHPIVPGQTFGWAPKGTGLLAYSELKSGRLILMDRNGETQKIDGTRNVVLPAWADDGARLAYLEGRGRNRYAVVVATVQK